jgi:DNA recombination protein RmuC
MTLVDGVALGLGLLNLALLVWLILRPAPATGKDEVLAAVQSTNERLERELRREISEAARGDRAELTQSLTAFQGNLTQQLQQITESNARRIGEVRQTLDTQLTQLQKTNELKLDEMRRTVDEKLQTTLETRLGESFKLVADRLDQVHKGLGRCRASPRALATSSTC